MRWHLSILVAAVSGALIACSPAEAPPDERTPPPAADAGGSTPAETATVTAPQVVHYDCEGTPVDASFDGGDRATVRVDGQTLAMQTEPAASGTKYVDGAGNVLWTRGAHDALLMRADQPDRSCTGHPADPV